MLTSWRLVVEVPHACAGARRRSRCLLPGGPSSKCRTLAPAQDRGLGAHFLAPFRRSVGRLRWRKAEDSVLTSWHPVVEVPHAAPAQGRGLGADFLAACRRSAARLRRRKAQVSMLTFYGPAVEVPHSFCGLHSKCRMLASAQAQDFGARVLTAGRSDVPPVDVGARPRL